MIDSIHEMTSAEIINMIFMGAATGEFVSMPFDIAESIVSHPNYDIFDKNIIDWAWSVIDSDTGGIE